MSPQTVGLSGEIPFEVTSTDVETLSGIHFTVNTSKEYYDLMTDYPYRLFNAEKEMIGMGGLELSTEIALPAMDEIKVGGHVLEISGAFTKEPPTQWSFELIQEKLLKQTQTLFTGNRVLLETGASLPLTVDVPAGDGGEENCAEITLSAVEGRRLQTIPLCR